MKREHSVDPRVQRSLTRLRTTLAELILEIGYPSVTILGLTERANVGYATFFRHYASLDELLREVLSELDRQLRAILPPSNSLSPLEQGQAIFEHVRANENLYRILLQDDGAAEMLREICDRSAAGAAAMLTAKHGDNQEVPISIVAHHWVEATISLMRWWLNQDKPFSPERMGEIYTALISYPATALLGKADSGQEP